VCTGVSYGRRSGCALCGIVQVHDAGSWGWRVYVRGDVVRATERIHIMHDHTKGKCFPMAMRSGATKPEWLERRGRAGMHGKADVIFPNN